MSVWTEDGQRCEFCGETNNGETWQVEDHLWFEHHIQTGYWA